MAVVHFPDNSLDDILNYIFDDGFNADFEEQTNTDVNNLTTEFANFVCTECKKSYKTKGGLSRHQKSKHQLSQKIVIDNLRLKKIIEQAATKLSEDFCFDDGVRNAFNLFSISTDECLVLWHQLKAIFDNFSGNAEKFYSKFYDFLQPGKPQLFNKLSRYQSTLLSTEVSNLCLELLSKTEDITMPITRSDIHLTEKQIASLEYLSGYCFRTVYARLRSSPKHRSMHSQQSISVLLAGKCNIDGEIPAQRLVDAKDRGGLWRVDEKVKEIFKICEIEFQIFASGFNSKLNAESLVSMLMKDVVIRSNFSYICGKAEIKVDKEIGKELLHTLLLLFVRVRSHSYANRIKEKHKQVKKEGKQKSLRTSIKKRSNATDLGH